MSFDTVTVAQSFVAWLRNCVLRLLICVATHQANTEMLLMFACRLLAGHKQRFTDI